MIVEKQAGEIIIRIADNFDDNELESMLDYIRYKEVQLLSKVQQFEIEKLTNELVEKISNIPSTKRYGYGIFKDKIKMSEDFDEPIEEFSEYI